MKTISCPVCAKPNDFCGACRGTGLVTCERALVAVAIDGQPHILSVDGPGLAMDAKDRSAEEMGIMSDGEHAPGLYLFDGYPALAGVYDNEPECEWRGEVRPVLATELPDMLAMKPAACPKCDGNIALGPCGADVEFCTECYGTGLLFPPAPPPRQAE